MMTGTVSAAHWPPGTAPELESRDFRAIAEMLLADTGIRLGEESRKLVFSRLTKHVRRLGLGSFGDYADLVARPDQAVERYRMVCALTTHTTRFFREGEHFEILRDVLLPALSEKARAGARVRMWSAGCSTGEEAYSIAATVLQAFPEAVRHDVRILATDVSRDVLATAEQGRYRASAMEGLPPGIAGILAEPEGSTEWARIREPVRDLVSFRYLNFMEPWPVSGAFDAIFCRNVAIYMAEDTQARIWAGLESVLRPDGVLFIGHSERLGAEFRGRLELCGKTTFCRPDDGRFFKTAG